MENNYQTPLKGRISLCRNFHENRELQRDASLYKILWLQNGSLSIEVDEVPMVLGADDVIALTPFQHINVKQVNGEYITLLFNSNFYCIYGHDNEVSCNGLLFHGSSEVLRLKLSPDEALILGQIVTNLEREYSNSDSLQEEMLRILLKRFIIICTRIARKTLNITPERERSFDIVRQFHVLVDNHFRKKKQVREYADMLNRSPKTLSNIFSACGQPSPLTVIHERVEAEAKRLLLYTPKSAKEVADILGFEDLATFSRFFRQHTGQSISEYRKVER
jgi:AraC family transcriptional activator of pobA